MSKKQLLEESTIRKFMKLANLEPLTDKFIKEDLGYTEEEDMGMPQDPMASPADDMEAPMGDEMPGDEEGELEVDLDDAGAEGDVSPEVARKVLQAVMDALNIQGTIEDDQGMGDDEDAGEMDDLAGDEEAGEDEEETGEEGFGGEEDAEEESGEEELEEAKEEVEESHLSEDELVENVLRRVTARLLAEAKKAKKGDKKEDKKDVKAKMKAKAKGKKEELDEEKHVVTHKKANPLLTKGGNKYKAFKGKADHVMGKGENGGKGDEEMKPLKATQKHTVTHDKTSKATGKGGNKA